MALINYITPIQFGAGMLASLDAELGRLGIQCPLFVTDQGIVDTGILDRAIAALGRRDFAVFAETDTNPSESNLRAALAVFAEAGCDGLIAIGGGSPMDLGKAVALLASQGGSFSDYNVKTGGSAAIRRVLPHVAIPTAAGTGAEIGRACVLTTDDGRKTVVVNLEMVAHSIICDPELTLTSPAWLTAATGIDALSHGIETFLSPNFNPPAEAIALDCITRITGNIERATSKGDDLGARTEMLMAALEGGMALQKGLGSAHAMATPLGELHLHHGTLIGVLLPHVLTFNAPAVPEKMARIKQAANLSGDIDLGGWLQSLVRRLGLPTSLHEMGVDRGVLPEIAAKANLDHLSATNPRQVNEADYMNLLTAAWQPN